MNKENLFGKTLTELTAICAEKQLPKFTAKQMADWLYKKHCNSIADMTNLSAKARETLSQNYEIVLSKPVQKVASIDGTKKYLYKISETNFVEAVFIPDDDRATLCISSQVGCKMNCSFCMTGKQGFQQNLSAAEIVNQIQSLPEFKQLTNIVYMGMGEPFDNIDEVLKSLEILTADWGYAMSPRRITVSTIGIIPQMQRFIEESQCHLAISLHSPFDEYREEIMPVQKKYSITEIVKCLKQYDWKGQRRLSFEYIMFSGFNDSASDFKELIKLLKPLDCRVNLIRFHKIPNVELKGSDMDTMEAFRDALNKANITATIRASRGEDIMAACGMLSSEKSKEEGDIEQHC